MTDTLESRQADVEVFDLLARNRVWAAGKTAADPGFFKRLVAQQAPPYLWIGCSDSRVPANEIVDLDPGQMFVHRNVANLAPPQDANFLSVLQFAVQVLKVRHVLVVGHYGCGGVGAALHDLKLGLIDHWLSPIRALARAHAADLDALPDEKARHDRLCELNVLAQVGNVAANPFVREAWAAGQPLSIHGWCYSLATGLVNDLGTTVSGPD
jgi:carbonic anhydrase